MRRCPARSIAVNGDLGTHPEAVNRTPHDAWMIRVKPGSPSELGALLDAAGYADLIK